MLCDKCQQAQGRYIIFRGFDYKDFLCYFCFIDVTGLKPNNVFSGNLDYRGADQ
jgi:hypothetical protein